MNTKGPLNTHIENFLSERQRLGFSDTCQARNLRSFNNHLLELGHSGPLSTDPMLCWAKCDSSGSNSPSTWARRLNSLRPFLRWLQQFEPLTEIPADSIFGRVQGRLTPHIYTQSEITDLLEEAGKLGPVAGIRGSVYSTLFGLIACAGLRISEAISLRNIDVNLTQGLLTIHQTKFGKTRQVPIHSSAVQALGDYRRIRDTHGMDANEETPFFITTRGLRCGMMLSHRQVHRVFSELRKKLAWKNRGAHHAPRIHDLRHTFVVSRILQWQKDGIDIDQAMLSLSTYVGHALVTHTYWYLTAVPELMSQAGDRFESSISQSERADEQ